MEDFKKSISKKSKTLKGEPLLSPAKRTLDNLQEGAASLNSLEGSFVQLDESLRRFLATLEIEIGDVIKLASDEGQDPEILMQSLQILWDCETARCAWVKWATMDHFVEKNLQWPFLSMANVEDSPKYCTPFAKPNQRSILLKSLKGLMKAYGVRGFVKGVEFTLAKSVHYFVYAMLTYRLVKWGETGQLQLEEFKNLFNQSSQKGIDTLVRELAKLKSAELKLILSAPALIGAAMGLNGLYSSRMISEAEMQRIADQVITRLGKSGNFCRDTLQEYLPIIFQTYSLSRKIQKLERAIRWDGRLSSEQRMSMFNLIHRVACEGEQMAQLHAMECLAKIAHGVGFKDLPKLKKAGYSKNDLLSILYTKATALQDLTALTEAKLSSLSSLRWWQIPSQFSQHIAPIPRRVYASYLLWWLGVSTSFLKQKLPFSTLKAAKLALETYFLYEIVQSVITAIKCPDKLGFKFAEGYATWASDYTAECFNTRLSLFRSIDPNENFDELMAEIGKYHLTDLTDLTLQNLNASEFKQLLQSVRQKAPHIETITAYGNQFDAFQIGTFQGLNQLKTLVFNDNTLTTLSSSAFDGLDGLQTLDLNYNKLIILSNTTFRGLVQLQKLDLSYNNLVDFSPNIFEKLIHLQYLDLGHNQFTLLPNGAFDRLVELQWLYLNSNQLDTLPAGIFSWSQNLYFLDLHDNQLTILLDDLFDGLAQLQYLYLSANPLTTLPLCVSQILSQLKGLGVDSSIITPDMFDYFTQLETLGLSGFTTLPVEITKLNHLKGLALDYNLFTHLPDGIFANFSQLRQLLLQNNQLITLSAGIFQGLNQLKTLSIYGNQLMYLPADIFNHLTQLQQLDLQANQLMTLPPATFNGLNQLEELRLGGNQLMTLPVGIFNPLRQLESLGLEENQLNDTAIFNLTQSFPYQLKELTIDSNFISDPGLAALVKVLPCTHLTDFLITPSFLPINDTSLLQKAQSELLEKVCSDRLCHANLPPAAFCPSDLDTATDSPALLGNNNTWVPNGYSSVFWNNKSILGITWCSTYPAGHRCFECRTHW